MGRRVASGEWQAEGDKGAFVAAGEPLRLGAAEPAEPQRTRMPNNTAEGTKNAEKKSCSKCAIVTSCTAKSAEILAAKKRKVHKGTIDGEMAAGRCGDGRVV